MHQRSYRGVDTPYADKTESQLALRYCEIAQEHDVKVTLFVTGRTCLEETDRVAALARLPHCEIGGHTYSAHRSFGHWLSRTFTGSRLGPKRYQERDIIRTIRAVRAITGKEVLVWRNHGYQFDQYTYPLLASHGIRIVSDRVSGVEGATERISRDLLSLPINTMPDHEHLLHGKYRSGRTNFERLRNRKSIEEWRETVERQVEQIEQHGGIATILAHPLCMEVADRMENFTALCRFLSRFKTGCVSDVAPAP
ncbi:MAG TPA: polysaccharide deacetylase family protein [Nitrospiraceae bacterium]|nr:polysaccharide deacetylase family protein [Nitrospiraceae bacterium]